METSQLSTHDQILGILILSVIVFSVIMTFVVSPIMDYLDKK